MANLNIEKILTIQGNTDESALDIFYTFFNNSDELGNYCKQRCITIDRHTLQAFDNRENVNFHILERIFADRFLELGMLSPRVELSILEFINIARTLRAENFPRQNYKRVFGDQFLFKSKGFSQSFAENLNVSKEVIHGILSFLQIELAYSSLQNRNLEYRLWQHVNDYIHSYELSISPGQQRLSGIINAFEDRDISAFFASISGGVSAFPTWGVFALDLYFDLRHEYFQTLSPFHRLLLEYIVRNKDIKDLKLKLSEDTGLLIKHQRSILYGLNWLVYGRPSPGKVDYEL